MSSTSDEPVTVDLSDLSFDGENWVLGGEILPLDFPEDGYNLRADTATGALGDEVHVSNMTELMDYYAENNFHFNRFDMTILWVDARPEDTYIPPADPDLRVSSRVYFPDGGGTILVEGPMKAIYTNAETVAVSTEAMDWLAEYPIELYSLDRAVAPVQAYTDYQFDGKMAALIVGYSPNISDTRFHYPTNGTTIVALDSDGELTDRSLHLGTIEELAALDEDGLAEHNAWIAEQLSAMECSDNLLSFLCEEVPATSPALLPDTTPAVEATDGLRVAQ